MELLTVIDKSIQKSKTTTTSIQKYKRLVKKNNLEE